MPPRSPPTLLRQFFPRNPGLFTPRIHPIVSRPATLPRPFSSTAPSLAKKGKEKSQKSSAPDAALADDPFDFSTLESGIERALSKLKTDLSKLRTGGRFNPETLENVRVPIAGKGERLGDLAQVLPKGGRSVVVLVGDKEHIKHITSAIQSTPNLNLNPQPDPHNPLQLTVPIPPPTKESRDLALAAASKVGESAGTAVRDARAAMQKRLRAMELRKAVRPDDLKKAQKEMEKIVAAGVADVKKDVDSARKGMEQT